MSRFERFVLFSASVVVVLLLGAAVPHSDAPAAVTTAAKVASILESVVVGPCPTNCEFSPCGDGKHNNQEHSSGNDGGEVHTCAFSLNQCADHTCSETFGQLENLIPKLNGISIGSLQERYAHFVINTDRRAIQVIGCGEQVLATVNMTPRQVADLSL